jgi:hypothetical protein
MARKLSRSPHVWLVPATGAVVLAAGVGASIALHHTDPTRLPTTLQVAAGATVTTPDGRTHLGRQGETLLPGSVVQAAGDRSAQLSALPAATGQTSAAQQLATLETDGRRVILGSGSRVQVVDGTDMVVEAGSLVSDRRHGPALHLRSDALQVSQLSGVIRVDHDSSTRVAAYQGRADLTNSSGRHLGVGALHQAIAAGLGLPQGQTPLQLRDDALDVAGDTVMVSLDQRLRSKATAVDADPKVTEVLSVVPVKAGPAAPPSEAVLPYVLGRAGHGGSETERISAAVSYRTGGGSWGAVARLVSADATGVDSAYAALVDQLGQVGAGQNRGTVLAGRTPTSVPGLGGTSAAPLTPPSTVAGRASSGAPTLSTPAGTVPAGTPTNGPTPRVTPTPPPPGGLLGGVLSVVQGVVGLLPGASPKPNVSLPGGVAGTVAGVTGGLLPGTVTTAGDAGAQARVDALHADSTALSRLLRHPVNLTPAGDVAAGERLGEIVEQVRPALTAAAQGTATPAQQQVVQQVTQAVTTMLSPAPTPTPDPAAQDAARRAAAQQAAVAASKAAAQQATQQAAQATAAAQDAARGAAQQQQASAQARKAAERQALIDQFNRMQAQEWEAAVRLAQQAPPALQQLAQQRLQAFAAQLAAQRAAAAAWLAAQS